ncbi:unnamed protein product, partial [Mesorhabditis spiculigera]
MKFRTFLTVITLVSTTALAVEEVCVQRYFGSVLDEAQVAALSTAFNGAKSRQKVQNYVATLNDTLQARIKPMLATFQTKIQFVGKTYGAFLQSVKPFLAKKQLKQVRAHFSDSLQGNNCDVARAFSDLYDYVKTMFTNDTATQQEVITAANGVLQKLANTTASRAKLVANMNFFLAGISNATTTAAPGRK